MADFQYYNGWHLPALPVWDESAYPYAYISICNNGSYAALYLVDKLGWIKEGDSVVEGDSPLHMYTRGETTASDLSLWFTCTSYVVAINAESISTLEPVYPGINTTAWLVNSQDRSQANLPAEYGPHWANFDVAWEDGTLFLKASAPTETPPGSEDSSGSGTTETASFDLKSWLTGFIVGMRVRSFSVVNADGSSGGSGGGSSGDDTDNDTARIKFADIANQEDIESTGYSQFQVGDVIMFVSSGDATEILGSSAAQAMIEGG